MLSHHVICFPEKAQMSHQLKDFLKNIKMYIQMVIYPLINYWLSQRSAILRL